MNGFISYECKHIQVTYKSIRYVYYCLVYVYKEFVENKILVLPVLKDTFRLVDIQGTGCSLNIVVFLKMV